jgi:hypothetical protein
MSTTTSTYLSGSTSVGTTATLILTFPAEHGGVLLSNTGTSNICYVGNTSVTATTGIPIAAGATLLVPSVGGSSRPLYGITSTSTPTITFLAPNP